MALDSFLMSSLNNFQNYLPGWEMLSDTQSSHMPAVDPSVVPGTGSPYMDWHEMETAASLGGQSDPYPTALK